MNHFNYLMQIWICKEDQYGTYGRLRVWIDTNENFSNRAGGTPNISHNLGSRVDHRYAFATCSNDANDANRSISCVISNWRLWVE